nr:RluA family pseudouridine synthase [Lacticaseibacillus saniviri]
MTLPEQGGITPNQGELKVVYEDKNWLVIDKPAGLTSVPGPSRPDDSVLNRVAGYLITQGKIAPQPAIMTRLDRDTTGLVLVAKHVLAQGWLDQLGVNKQVTKRYLALAVGHLPQQSGTFDQPLGMAEDGIHRMVRADGQQALTQYRVLQESAHYSLVELNLVTGRTHQIRVHMAHAGHPLVGDPLYGETIPALQHQALLAYQLTFLIHSHKRPTKLNYPCRLFLRRYWPPIKMMAHKKEVVAKLCFATTSFALLKPRIT